MTHESERVIRQLMTALRYARRTIINEASGGTKGEIAPNFWKIDKALKRGRTWLRSDHDV